MRHVQRLGNQGRTRTMAGSLALISGLALFSVVRAPGAIGQLATVNIGNSGVAAGSTGGNNATGNASGNGIDSTATGGGLVAADVGLGATTNTSTGTATINTGPATASGNESQTGVGQTNAGTGSSSSPFGDNSGNNQSVNITNSGDAISSTGDNTAVGNNSDNNIGSTSTIGLVDATVGLAPTTNTSTGTSNITTGPATAVGNVASAAVNQARITDDGTGGFGSGAGGFGSGAGGGAGFFHATPFQPGVFPGTVNGFGSSFDPCSGRFFPFSPFLNDPSGQRAAVDNSGVALATTGNNTAVGNNSTNTQTISQTASGGLIGLNVNLGSPTNNSTGTATINTGAANATGNQAATTVNQFCGDPNAGSGNGQPFTRNVITGGPAIPVSPIVVNPAVQVGTLARTGFESGMIVIAVALVMFGLALLFSARKRLSPASGPVSTAEWDSIVRW